MITHNMRYNSALFRVNKHNTSVATQLDVIFCVLHGVSRDFSRNLLFLWLHFLCPYSAVKSGSEFFHSGSYVSLGTLQLLRM